MVSGSTYSVQSLFVSVAIESHKLVLDHLKDLQASILLKPTASTPEGPPEPLVLRAASLIISPLICWYAESVISSTGPNNSALKLAFCATRVNSKLGRTRVSFTHAFPGEVIVFCNQVYCFEHSR